MEKLLSFQEQNGEEWQKTRQTGASKRGPSSYSRLIKADDDVNILQNKNAF